MMLIDSHCHLDFAEFAPERDEVVARARAAGLARMITISTRVARFAEIAALAAHYDDVYCTVGTHPLQAAEEPDIAVETLLTLARNDKCVGIGEAGLDYHYDAAPRDLAARVFRTHIDAARRSGLPLVIHSRDADADMADILTDEMARGPFGAVLHCFTAGERLADVALELGLYISFSGVVTFKSAKTLHAIAARVPLDRILVETDAPFLAPMPHRGSRNEPAYVIYTAAHVARLRDMPDVAFAAAASANTLRLFAKMPAPAAT